MSTSSLLRNTAFFFDEATDGSAPAALLAPVVSLVVDSGSSSTDHITNDFSLNVTGLAGALIEYSFDGIHWDTAMPTSLSDGTYTIKVRQSGYNASPEATDFTFTYDTTAPQKLSVSLANDTGNDTTDRITSDAALKVGNEENDSSIEYSLDAGVTWTTTAPANLAEGDYTVLVRQTDAAGNSSDPTALDFTIKNEPGTPTLVLAHDTGSSTTDHITSDATITVSGLVSGATITYFIDGDEVGVSELPTEWTDGDHSVTARQTDSGGTSHDSTLTFTLDTEAPDVLEIALKHDNGGSNFDGITSDYTFDVTGIETGALVEYSLDGGVTWSTKAPSGLSYGDHTVTVRQTDLAGNVSDIAALDFTVVDPHPTVNFVAPLEKTWNDGGLY